MSAQVPRSTGREMSTQFRKGMPQKGAFRAVLVACMLAGAGFGQSSIPDAQVESNVLKALASAPELASEQITTRTVDGTVTLSGTVSAEQARNHAEQLSANTDGVRKVVDELRLGAAVPSSTEAQTGTATPLVPLSDGTYGPAPARNGEVVGSGPAYPAPRKPEPGSAPAIPAQRNNPEADQELDLEIEQGANRQGTPLPAQPNAPAQPYAQGAPNQYPNQYPGQYPNQTSANPGPSQSPGSQPPYYAPSPGGPAQPGTAQAPPSGYSGYPYPQRPMYYPGYGQGYPPAPYPPAYSQSYPPSRMQDGQQPFAGQPAGLPVVVPPGTPLRVRVNQTLRSDRTQPGTAFEGIIVNDVQAGGYIAIPRGAAVQGTVLDAKSSGALTGRGEMSIQLTSVTLGGKLYPLVTDVWAHNGGDKTIETVNKTAGFGAAGALIGALAGGGAGAAIGGGVGAAAGLGSSAASGHGQVFIPSEAVVTFHTAQPASVATVSQGEMQRLAYGVPPGADSRPVPRPYPPAYVAPGYYPGNYPGSYRPYGPYGPPY